MSHLPWKRIALALCVSAPGAVLLSGCSGNFAPSPVADYDSPIGDIRGSVHGGQAPVTGAHIYLYAAGTSGYGTNAKSLIRSTASNATADSNGNYYVTTDSNGNFALGGDYSCTQGQQVYMVAVGGNPGQGGSINNAAIVQMAGLGQCPASGNLAAQVPYLVINEVTTVAFAYAMSGFATTPYNVSSNAANSAASATAIANAMAQTLNIVNIQYGQSPAHTNGNATSTNPVNKIYALANILATCVNTTGPGPGTACNALFAAATDSSGNAATDEASAIFNIAHNQGQNVNAIWNRMPSTPVFSPNLTTQPSDWTLPIVYPNVLSQFGTNTANQVISGAYNIAFDVNGTAWIGDRVKGLVEMSPLGAVQTFTNANFGMIKGIAVTPDSTSIWLTDYQKSSVYIMSTAGALTKTFSGSGFDLSGPAAVAFDENGYSFVVNQDTPSIVVLTPTASKADAYSGGIGVTTPAWISLDQNGNAWIPSTKSDVIAQAVLNYAGNSGHLKGVSATTMSAAESYGIAIDSSGNAWFASNSILSSGAPDNESLDEFSPQWNNKHSNITGYSSNGSESGTGYNGGGLGIPYKITIDGGNNIWLANEAYGTVSEFSQTLNRWMGVPGTQGVGVLNTGEVDETGLSNGSTGNTLSATPDNSGNLWTANTDGSVTVLLGVATPTANPIHPSVLGTMP